MEKMTGADNTGLGSSQIANIPFVLTRQVKEMGSACVSLIATRDMGVAHGEAGVGKTLTAARMIDTWKKRGHPKGLYVSADVRISPRQMMRKILREYDDIRPAHDDDAKQVLKTLVEKKHIEIIIVDEAERLSRETLDFVRSIFDDMEVPILLIGMMDLLQKLRSHKKFYSRIGIAYNYTALTYEQLQEHLKALHPLLDRLSRNGDLYNQLVEFVFKTTNGEFRRIARLIKQGERIRILNNCAEFSLEIFKMASESLLNP